MAGVVLWELAQVKRKLLQEKGKEKLSEAGKIGREKQLNGGLSNNDKGQNHNTREELSKELGWSTGKVAQAEQVWEKGKENIVEAQKERHSGVSLSNNDKDRNHNTREELSKELGWSTELSNNDKTDKMTLPNFASKRLSLAG